MLKNIKFGYMSDEKKQSDALRYHAEGRPGKIQVIPTK